MWRLLAKDFKAVGLFWVSGLIINIFFVISFIEVNLAFLFSQLVLTFLLTLVQPAIEDRFGLASFLNSLPVTRADMVKAQYLSTGLLVLAGLALFVAVPSGLGWLIHSPQIKTAPLLAPAGFLSFLLPVVLLELLFLPLYFRQGLGKSIWYFLASLLGLAVILTGALRIISRLYGRPLAEIFPVDRGIMAVPYKPFLPLAGRLQAGLGTAGLALVGLLTLSGLVWLSMSLAIRFYKRREF
ncbi:MAG TPA: ABC-2 transporter permease [Acidobacteriota bacterium]